MKHLGGEYKKHNEDVRVIKTYLREQGSNTLFLCGFSAVGCVLSTWVGAQDKDYNAFMVKDAIMSHDPDYTNHVEEMFYAVGYDAVKLIVESSGPAAK